MNFGQALEHLKNNDKNAAVTRSDWYGSAASPIVKLQKPDDKSFMSEPYLYMEKTDCNCKQVRFPLDLSCESILSEKWEILK